MLFKDRVEELQKKIQDIQNDTETNKQNKLPENCWFLSETEVVCFERPFGDSRYPYSKDGLTLWAYASGGLRILNGTFNVVLDSYFGGHVPNLCFYAGRKIGDKYFPISLTGAGRVPMEEDVKRYTVFASEAVYYFTETKDFTSCVRMFVDEKQNLRFSVRLVNGAIETDTYVVSYFNPLLRNAFSDDMGTKFFKSCKYSTKGFEFRVIEDVFRSDCHIYTACMSISEEERPMHTTTSYSDFAGSMHNTVNGSTSLQNGTFEQGKEYTEFTDNAVAATIVPLHMSAHESYEISYTVAIAQDDEEKAQADANQVVCTPEIDALLYEKEIELGRDIPFMEFEDVQIDGVEDVAFHHFMKSVFRQVEFCSRAKNYGGALIGIRDIFQQLEAALMWIPDYCRGKILEALNYIGDDGRAPRQYSYPAYEGALPVMDLRPFIDQGVWVISTIYTYLAVTEDYSILEEVCGYYHFEGQAVSSSSEKDSVLSHMIRIIEYLTSNLDDETNCLHILYGDWNDALDGLGESNDESKEYGTGVSVMGTLQFYQNLREMIQIMNHLGMPAKAKEYETLAQKVSDGLMKYAVDINEDGKRKIIHGWGDKYSYKIGSFCDNDGQNRDGLTSNAFWILSGMIKADESLKQDIVDVFKRLDSKYGYKTFEPYFALENKKVGRITHLPRGTAENGATYIHATMFAIWALFELGEAKLAWKQLEKVLPLTHEHLTHTPFVMPNSYSYDMEKGFDGESMNDWFTGSGCVLVKILIWYIFGIKADLNGITISPAKVLPMSSMELRLRVKGGEIALVYRKTDCGTRTFEVNGKAVLPVHNESKDLYEIKLQNADITGQQLEVKVCD